LPEGGVAVPHTRPVGAARVQMNRTRAHPVRAAVLGSSVSVVVLAACGHRTGLIYAEGGDILVQVSGSHGNCTLAKLDHSVEVHASRDGALLATATYSPTSWWVFDIGPEPFDASANIDGRTVTQRVVPTGTRGTMLRVDLVVPTVGCNSPSPATS
jgi:hypothetical protein